MRRKEKESGCGARGYRMWGLRVRDVDTKELELVATNSVGVCMREREEWSDTERVVGTGVGGGGQVPSLARGWG